MNAAAAIATAIDKWTVGFSRVYHGDGNSVFRKVTPCYNGGNLQPFRVNLLLLLQSRSDSILEYTRIYLSTNWNRLASCIPRRFSPWERTRYCCFLWCYVCSTADVLENMKYHRCCQKLNIGLSAVTIILQTLLFQLIRSCMYEELYM